MLKMSEFKEDSSQDDSPGHRPGASVDTISNTPPSNGNQNTQDGGWLSKLLSMFSGKAKSDASLRETIEEYIEEPENGGEEDEVAQQERWLLSNILALRDLTVDKVMVPRADILAIDMNTSQQELFDILKEKQHTRIPVYRDTLDDVLGTVHLKDIMAAMAQNKKIDIKPLLSDLPIVAPSMPILDLLMKMQESRRHMVLVVDEYGGIDGLVTIGDIIEFIVGEIDDEHDTEDTEKIVRNDDGSVTVDSRLNIDHFEEEFGAILSEEERSDNDTLGGLVFSIAGRVPSRGEVLTHNSGMIFEVMEADPRRISKLKIRKIPQAAE